MISKLRHMIAYYLSIALIFISFGIIKPNFSGDPTTSAPEYQNKSETSFTMDDPPNTRRVF